MVEHVGYQEPDDSQRVAIIGKTGSGKTQGAAWMLSRRSYDTRPWIIIDFKREPLFREISGTKEHKLGSKLPKEPGLYICRPIPGDENGVEELMWAIWERENTGLYVDEGLLIDPYSQSLQAILTQGRSKSIPVIMLTQRPTKVSRFVFSEADYIQLYQLTDTRDIKTVKQFMPMPIEEPLQKYWSYWWDNANNYKAILKPSPNRATILREFNARLGTRRSRY